MQTSVASVAQRVLLAWIGWGALGCGPFDNERLAAEARGLNCETAEYTPFRAGGAAEVEAQVGAMEAIAREVAEAIEVPAEGPERFEEIDELYRTNLRAAVLATVDATYGDGLDTSLGAALDLTIVTAIARGETSTQASQLGPLGATVGATLVRFAALAAASEVREGTWDGYDAAMTYLGVGTHGAPQEARSVAAALVERGGDGADLFAAGLAGACALDRALLAANARVVTWSADPALDAAVDGLDEATAAALAEALVRGLASIEALDELAAAREVLADAELFAAIEPALRRAGVAEGDLEAITADFAAARNALDIGGDPARVVDIERVIAVVSAAFALESP